MVVVNQCCSVSFGFNWLLQLYNNHVCGIQLNIFLPCFCLPKTTCEFSAVYVSSAISYELFLVLHSGRRRDSSSSEICRRLWNISLTVVKVETRPLENPKWTRLEGCTNVVFNKMLILLDCQ